MYDVFNIQSGVVNIPLQAGVQRHLTKVGLQQTILQSGVKNLTLPAGFPTTLHKTTTARTTADQTSLGRGGQTPALVYCVQMLFLRLTEGATLTQSPFTIMLHNLQPSYTHTFQHQNKKPSSADLGGHNNNSSTTPQAPAVAPVYHMTTMHACLQSTAIWQPQHL